VLLGMAKVGDRGYVVVVSAKVASARVSKCWL
jgi:hypothetical protein